MNSPSRHPKPQRQATAPSSPPTEKVAARAAEPTRTDGALNVNGLTKSYGERIALEPLDLHIGRGERVALIGHNGSGKTTLMRLTAGLLEPSGGSSHVLGNPSGSLPARAALSYIADTPTFYDDLSLWEHLEYIARLHGVAEWEQHAADLLGHLDLYERGDDLPNTFSRGLRQKAAIVLAFIRPFDLLLVDEPFVGLDATGRAALLELLEQAGDDGAALVVATHELGYVTNAARMIALRDGAVIHDGAPDTQVVAELVSRG